MLYFTFFFFIHTSHLHTSVPMDWRHCPAAALPATVLKAKSILFGERIRKARQECFMLCWSEEIRTTVETWSPVLWPAALPEGLVGFRQRIWVDFVCKRKRENATKSCCQGAPLSFCCREVFSSWLVLEGLLSVLCTVRRVTFVDRHLKPVLWNVTRRPRFSSSIPCA